MPKILAASCAPGKIITVEGFVVPTAVVLSAGAGLSSGIVIFDKDKQYYLTSNADDIKSTIDKLDDLISAVADAVTQIGTTLTSIGANMTGPTTVTPPTLPVDVVTINAKVLLMNQAKAALDILKGTLK